MGVEELYRQSRRAALLGIGVSLGLGLVKLIGGLFGHSMALQADSLHSVGDAIVSGALLGALILAERPADREHPYGHARAEAVAASCVALFLIVMALVLGWRALSTLHQPHLEPAAYTLTIAAAGALIQEALYRYGSRVARQTGSLALRATAWDYRLDALASLAVLGAVALAKWGGPSWRWADSAAAVAVAATIFWIGCRLSWDNFQELMDRQADPDLLKTVRREVLTVPGVLGVEKLRVRKTGLEYLVDIHVEVDPDLTVRAGHAIAHNVKNHVTSAVVMIRDVLVHIEPSPATPAKVNSP